MSKVYERIRAPLLTLVSSGSPEQPYAVLGHLHLLVMRAPILFSSDYKHLYCQYNEPFYVKKLKLEMLTAVTNESNTYEIVTELCEYAANVDIPIARESNRAVGKIALQQYDVNAVVDKLLQFLEMEKDYVTAHCHLTCSWIRSIGAHLSTQMKLLAYLAQQVEANDKDLPLSTSEKEDARSIISNGSAYSVSLYDSSAPLVASQTQPNIVSLDPTSTSHTPSASLTIDDLLGLGLSITPAPISSPQPLTVNPKAVLDPGTFQQKWRQLPVSLSEEYSVIPQGVASLTEPQALLQHMQGHSIQCIASGGQSPNLKFFFSARKDESSSCFLVECVINTLSAKAQIKVKADYQGATHDFASLFKTALFKFGMA